MSAVKLDDVRVTLRDAKTPLEGRVAVQSLTTGRLANQGESPVSLRATLALSKPPPIKRALAGKTTLALDPDKKCGSPVRHEARAQLDGAGFNALALGVGAARLGRRRAATPVRSARLRRRARRAEAAPVAARREELLFAPPAQKLELDALKLALAGQHGANPP